MSARRLMGGAAAAFAGGLVLSVCPALTVANPPAARASSLAILQITTVPAVPDAHVILDGVTHLTGVTGTLTISTFAGTHRIEARPPTSPPPATAVRFSRWLDGITQPGRAITLHQGLNNVQVGFQLSHPISVRFSAGPGRPVPLSAVQRITIANSVGRHYTFAPDQPPSMLPANRIVRGTFGLVALRNRYSIREVMYNGANVVYSGKESFWVKEHHTWTVRLLLFPMRIEVRDALFGFAVGSTVKVRLAGGSSRTVRLGPGHAVTLRGMPRATYELVAKGPGIGLSSPATLTKPLVARLLLLSWVDFAAAGAFVVLFVIGLPLLGGRIRRRADGGRLLAWHVGHPADRAGQPGKVTADQQHATEQHAAAEMPAVPEARAVAEIPAAPDVPVVRELPVIWELPAVSEKPGSVRVDADEAREPAETSLVKGDAQEHDAGREPLDLVPRSDVASGLSRCAASEPPAAGEPWQANGSRHAAAEPLAVAANGQGAAGSLGAANGQGVNDSQGVADGQAADEVADDEADTDPSPLTAEQVTRAARLAWERRAL